MKYLVMDFETRSPVDLREKSTTRYAKHPETDILCIGLKWAGKPATALVPVKGMVLDGTIRPIELMHAIEHRIPIVVHNLSFEKRIYRYICHERWGWPAIPDDLWIDTIASCRYYAIPAALEKAAKALGLNAEKDMEGNRIMLQLSKPRKPRKAEVKAWLATHESLEGMPHLWWEDRAKLDRVVEYCKQDLVTQEQLLLELGPLPPDRYREWRFDDMVNERGIAVDWCGAYAALDVVTQGMAGYNQELAQLTATPACPQGMVTAVTQRKKILDWCELNHWTMVSTNKESVEDALSSKSLPSNVRRVLEIVQAAGKSSLGKLETMIDLTDDDFRVRDTLAWHGAATGRKAGRGIQPQNFPRDCLKRKEAEEFFELLTRPDAHDLIRDRWPEQSVPDTVSSALRAFIVAGPGKELFVSDFSNIETRILAWLANCRLLNEAFSSGACPYRQFARRIFNLTQVQADAIEKDAMERRLGKAAVLGLGYGMGADKFQVTAASPLYRVDLDLVRAGEIKNLYRSTYVEVPEMWKAYEKAMMEAIENHTQVQVGRVAFGASDKWGWIILPSGRPIWMKEPKVKRVPNRWQEGKTMKEISYMGLNLKKQWVRRSTYGGSLTESVCQGTAADLLQEAMQNRLEPSGFPVIVSVHDEVVCEVPLGSDFDKFHSLVKARPAWAADLPIECESSRGRRYGK